MNPVKDIIDTYEVSVSQLRDQKKPVFPTLSLCGDDAQFMDTSYIIEAINEIKDQLPDDCSVIAARIVADLAELHEMISDKNAIIKESNEILDEQVGDLHTALETQLADVPEVKLTRAIKIGTKHLNAIQLSALSKVYDTLNLTHVRHEERKDIVYHNYDETPNLSEVIISTFHTLLEKEENVTVLDCMLTFRNFVHSEDVQGFTSDLIKVIKSKRG